MSPPAYYNEIEPFAVEALRLLSGAGEIAPGVVDSRSIAEVRAGDTARQSHFFAGLGLWSYALRLAGVPDDFPVWTGSCPCQPFSVAGLNKGIEDERHLWPEWHRLISERRPPIIFGEQVASRPGRAWLSGVRADLEALGYGVGAADLCAAGLGAPHVRQRLFWAAYSVGDKQSREESRRWAAGRVGWELKPLPWNTSWEAALAQLRVLDDGHPRSVGATDAARNAIVPQVAAAFVWSTLEAIAEGP